MELLFYQFKHMKKLDIILRTCQRSSLDANLNKSSPEYVRICGPNREEMVFRCVLSLITAINNAAGLNIELTVLDDRSSQSFLDKLSILLNRCKKPHKIIQLTDTGPNNSAYQQFLLASNCEDLIYSVEDDYLHEPGAIISMLSAYRYLKQKFPSSYVTIFPFDCPFRYEEGRESTTVLYHDGFRYWREVSETTNTFLASANQLKFHFKEYKTLALEYPKVLEEDTINKLYFNRDSGTGSVRAFNPIPSCAYHLSYCSPKEITVGHTSWKHLWDSSLYLDLFEGWYNYADFYSAIANQLRMNANIIEVGSWLGKSVIGMANHNKRIGKLATFFCVDTWEGSEEEKHYETINQLKKIKSNPKIEFMTNIDVYGVKDCVVPIQSTSEEASKQFDDGFADVIIIDAAHDYDNVINDIRCWIPKVMKGGIIAGDDYSPSWPGVVQAVKEYFGEGNYNVIGTTWYKILT